MKAGNQEVNEDSMLSRWVGGKNVELDLIGEAYLTGLSTGGPEYMTAQYKPYSRH